MDNAKLECYLFRDIVHEGNAFIVHFDIKNKYIHTYDFDCADDVVTVKKLITDYLKQHPSNELNGRKIFLCFGMENIAPVSWVTNYIDYDSQNEPCSANDFNYYDGLIVKNLSSLEKLESVKRLSVYTDNIDYVQFLQNWDKLEYLEIRYDRSEENEAQKEAILEMFDTYSVTENSDHVLKVEKNTV
ncbi:MAG: hypothetical protein K2N72_02700 [Oscillospiraceae bacterium]|nr:hypothetical protein [Oscillospiraceae bacterium]